ncbi:hypothetical protein GQ43DRAFT_160949 [Delitschia confertaspora ATCC 74209]|uniref:Uncharacterized protein n=1 Tax=Delitschia confertaspora ATCC 74209 TaxID=1513339 RepID=A0A9P4JU86_9PLEO|nr:hypothetical protein GQ43DRAFT_160949 [Delitschia confertaspora ATCC 74209]
MDHHWPLCRRFYYTCLFGQDGTKIAIMNDGWLPLRASWLIPPLFEIRPGVVVCWYMTASFLLHVTLTVEVSLQLVLCLFVHDATKPHRTDPKPRVPLFFFYFIFLRGRVHFGAGNEGTPLFCISRHP